MRGLNVIKHKSLDDAVRFHQEQKTKAPKQQGKGAPVLFWYCKGNGQNGQHSGWRYIKADRTVAPGVLEYPEGHFVLRRMIDGKRIYEKVNGDGNGDGAAKIIKQANENHKNGNVNAEGRTIRTLRGDATAYVKSLGAREVFRMEVDAERVLFDYGTGFLRIVPNLPTYTRDITVQHFTDYINALRALHKKSTGAHNRQGERTVENKAHHLRRFLQWAEHPGLPKWKWKELIKRAERPTPNEFSKGELARLRQGAGEVTIERILLEMGCQLGLREGEMRHAEFTDINRDKMLFTVRSKPKFNFSVKKNKQRSIPVSNSLVELLDKWCATVPEGQTIIFARNNSTHQPYAGSSLYNRLARLAAREDVKVDDAHPHRMRRTAITRWLRKGIDVKTVQKLAGHERAETTLESYAVGLEVTDPQLHAKMAAGD
jgi:integrase